MGACADLVRLRLKGSPQRRIPILRAVHAREEGGIGIGTGLGADLLLFILCVCVPRDQDRGWMMEDRGSGGV